MKLQELSSILEKAKQHGARVTVSRAGIVVDFGDSTTKEAAPTAPAATTAPDPGGPAPEAPKSLLTPSDTEALREMERSQALIDDPLQYEADQIDGFLKREQEFGQGPVA